ncbi:MAG: VWA domain-containing protein [Acidobacteria bacterium]|nr:VWA domain-containing protein [Acidobacteriota bacterium]
MSYFLSFAVAALLTPLFFPLQEHKEMPVPIVRAMVDVVNIVFTVKDRRSAYVPNLNPNEFEVYENGVLQKVEFFSYQQGKEAQPLTVVLLVDTSGSVKDKLEYEKAAALQFLKETLRENRDFAAVVQFDSEVNVVHDFTPDLSRLFASIYGIRAGGSTKLYDAICLTANELFRGETGRKVMVVLSDGADNQSVVGMEEAIKAAQEEDVIIYGIGVKSSSFGSDFDKLEGFAKATGGAFFKSTPDPSRLREVFGRINQEIKNQYSIGYISSNRRRDGSFRGVEIRVKRSGLKVRHRKGYYAPQEDKG